MSYALICYQIPTIFTIAILQTTEMPNWATLGIGGILAGLMFWFYREDRKRSEERLNEIIKDYRDITRDNTVATRECSNLVATLLERLREDQK